MNKLVFKKYLNITIGIIILAVALQFFYYPNDIAAGGVSGFALILHSYTGLSTALVMNIFNIVLFILAFVLIGREFIARSVFASFGLSFALAILEKLFPGFAVTKDPVLAIICGSTLAAFGMAMVFNENSSTGGTDIIAKILNKYIRIEIGKCLLIADCVVIILALLTFGIEESLYGLIACIITGILIDKFIEGFNGCKQVIIISEKSKEIQEYIINEIDRGCTKLIGTGAYSDKKVNILYVVVHGKQFITLKNKIREIDHKAFITVSDAKEVLGEGFDSLVEN